MGFAIFPRGDAVCFFEGILEIVAVRKTAAEGNFRDRVIGGNQFKDGVFEPDKGKVLVDTDPGSLSELFTQIIRTETDRGSDLRRGNRFGVMTADVFCRVNDLPVSRVDLRGNVPEKITDPSAQQKKGLQNSLQDRV